MVAPCKVLNTVTRTESENRSPQPDVVCGDVWNGEKLFNLDTSKAKTQRWSNFHKCELFVCGCVHNIIKSLCENMLKLATS